MNSENNFSQTAPSVFDGENYHLWDVRMETYLEALDLWEAMEEDYDAVPLPDNPTMKESETVKEYSDRLLNIVNRSCHSHRPGSDADLENMPYGSAFNHGAPSTCPLLLIEPSYKINGEDRSKGRPIRVNDEEDTKEKATMKPTPDSKVETKSGPASDPKTKKIVPANSHGKDVPISDLKIDPKVDKMAFAESKDGTKMSLDQKPSKTTVKNTSKPVSKVESKSAEVGISDSKDLPENISSNKLVKKVSQGSGRSTNVVDNSATSPSDVREKTDSVPSTSQSKREDEKPHLCHQNLH
ncbi:hypothetical protein FXO38_19902 [Capsicum annuum]|nr:hypothetical protein FXO37_21653 [Capsicum annuum]KAF3644937.1 hypothetical protein FXO38_19902 [Capsicum annuum]